MNYLLFLPFYTSSGVLSVSHAEIEEAITLRYLKTQGERISLHVLLAGK